MPECGVCGGNDFVEEDGLYYCTECNTRNEDVRVEVFTEKFAEDTQQSQWMVSTQIKVEREDEASNIKILTSWETFNICLRGLVNQLTEFGATVKFEAMIFKLWVEYLQKTDAAFFSKHKKPPKLPKHAWTSDAFLVYNIQKDNKTVEEVVGKKQKGKRSISAIDDANDSREDGEPASKTSKLNISSAKKSFFAKDYANKMADTTTTLHDTTELSDIKFTPRTQTTISSVQILSKESNPDIVPLRRKHLLAFIYLGLQITQQDIQLSDVLRWIDEGHLHYHQLNKYFMPGVAVLDDLKEYFMTKTSAPKYKEILHLSCKLARFLCVRTLLPNDVNALVHKFCNEFNLPNQVALVSRRLLQLLPVRCQCLETSATLISWECRAMAQVIVTLKILLGLDDVSEHRNSTIALQIYDILRQEGSTIEPFIWDDWVRWSALRSLALMLHGKTTACYPKNTGLYQNIDLLVSIWGNFVSTSTKALSAKKKKTETELMVELLRNLSNDSFSFCNLPNQYPVTRTPLATYTEVIYENLMGNKLPCSDKSWNVLVENIDFTELLQDFRCKSIEYLLHPERYIDWAQQKGLSVGLRFGGAFQNTFKSKKVTVPKVNNQTSNLNWRVSLTEKSKEKRKREIQCHSTKSVVLPAATKTDNTGNRPLEPLLDLTDHLPVVKITTESANPSAPAAFPSPGEENKYLHIPSTEYYTHSRKAQDAPISFRYLVDSAARYLHVSRSLLLEEIAYVESIHHNFLNFCSGKTTAESSQIIALKK